MDTTRPGTYPVTVTVTDDEGNSTVLHLQYLVVEPPAAPEDPDEGSQEGADDSEEGTDPAEEEKGEGGLELPGTGGLSSGDGAGIVALSGQGSTSAPGRLLPEDERSQRLLPATGDPAAAAPALSGALGFLAAFAALWRKRRE